MTVYFDKGKHLEVTTARRTESGDLEVLEPKFDTAISVYLVEYNSDWLVVLEFPREKGQPKIDTYQPYKIENQLDVYKLNAAL